MAVSFIKGTIKMVFIVGIAIAGLVVFNKVDVSQFSKLADVSKLDSTYIMQVKQIADVSKDSIKLDTSNGYSLSVKVNDQWINTADIAKIKSISDTKCTIEVQGKDIEVTDETICKLFNYLQENK